MTTTKRIIIAAVTALLISSCSMLEKEPKLVRISGVVFGTYYTVSYYEEEGRVFQHEIDSIFDDFNSSLSFYDKESLLSRINRNEATGVDDYFVAVFNRAREIYVETDGAFDPTVFPLVNAWGFGLSVREEMTPERVDSLLNYVGFDRIRLENGNIVKETEDVQLDFNAIAKGYAADIICDYLVYRGVYSCLVEIGGDLATRGLKPDGTGWRIGLEIPAADMVSPQEWDYFVEIHDTGLATSGDYRRYQEVDGKRYSHTIDPVTGYPVEHNMLSASVFAPDGMSADAYATALMVMGPERAIEFVEAREDLEAYLILAGEEDGEFSFYASTGLELKTRDDL